MENKKIIKINIFLTIIAICLGGFLLYLLMSGYKSSNTITVTFDDEDQDIVDEAKIVYLAINEEYHLDDTNYHSDNEEIAVIDGDIVIGKSVGKTVLSNRFSSFEVEITDMIIAPQVIDNKKELPCGYYSKEDNEYLDMILSSKIKNVGYQTRAGVVEAARFLTLQFPYHLTYFPANGRQNYVDKVCDGEGTYYFDGLYLNTYKEKKDGFSSNVSGPAEWGCKIYSESQKEKIGNSLDDYGFLSWCLKNGGYNFGDIGIGSDSAHGYSQFAYQNKLTKDSLSMMKVGDIFLEENHVSILIGLFDNQYYVAESKKKKGVRVVSYTIDELLASKKYAWIDMTNYYKNDGKLTNYWEKDN